MPKSVSLVLDVYNYEDSDFRVQLPAEEGASVEQDGTLVEILHLAAGHHVGWSSRDGFHGDAKSIDSSCEVLFQLTGNPKLKGSIWVVTKDGRRWDLKSHGWLSAGVSAFPIELPVKLSDIKHFEFLPHRKKSTICFENLQLPARREPLEQHIPTITFEIDGEACRHVSDILSPLSVELNIMQGKVYVGSSSEHGFTFSDPNVSDRDNKNKSTAIWIIDGARNLFSKLEYSDGLDIHPTGTVSWQMGWSRGAARIAVLDVPLAGVKSAEVKFSIKRDE